MLRYETYLREKPGELLRTARDLVRINRAQGLAALNDLFRAGSVPDPAPDGRYAGEMIALDLAPGLTPLFLWLTNRWMPWLGKTFNSSNQSRDSIFTKDSYILARLFNPLYRGFTTDSQKSIGALPFTRMPRLDCSIRIGPYSRLITT